MTDMVEDQSPLTSQWVVGMGKVHIEVGRAGAISASVERKRCGRQG